MIQSAQLIQLFEHIGLWTASQIILGYSTFFVEKRRKEEKRRGGGEGGHACLGWLLRLSRCAPSRQRFFDGSGTTLLLD